MAKKSDKKKGNYLTEISGVWGEGYLFADESTGHVKLMIYEREEATAQTLGLNGKVIAEDNTGKD